MVSDQPPTISEADTAGEVGAVIAGWGPRSLSPLAAGFVRTVVARAAPETRARTKALLFAASKLACFGERIGLEPSAGVLLHPSVIERFILQGADGVSPATRRTLRTNLRALARALSLTRSRRRWRSRGSGPRRRIATRRSPGIWRSPACSRRCRGGCAQAALVCLGAGAGLIGAELRHITGEDVIRRSGGLLVVVSGAEARVVPVLERFHEPLTQAAGFAADGYLIGGSAPARRNLTDALTVALCHRRRAATVSRPGGCGPPGSWRARS